MTHIEILKYMYTHFKVAFGVRKDGGRKGEEGKNVPVLKYFPTPPPLPPAFHFQFSIDHLQGVIIFSSSICTLGFYFHL